MLSQQFCYWLQGSFELNESLEFNTQETQIIKSHLDLVFKNDPRPNQFCQFLNGYFIFSKTEELDKEVTSFIKEDLRQTFKNEIDPSYPKNEQQKLNEIHNHRNIEHPSSSIVKC